MSITAGPSLPSLPGKEGTDKSSPAAITEKDGARTRDAVRARLDREVGRQAQEMTLPRADTVPKGPVRVMSTNWAVEHEKMQRDRSARVHGTYSPMPTPQGSAMQMGQAIRSALPSSLQAGSEAVRARLAAAAERAGAKNPATLVETATGAMRIRTPELPQAFQKDRDEGLEPEW